MSPVRTLIRFLTRTAGGTVETRDRIVDGDAITLGRATDRTLHLKDARVALEHARIFRSGGRTLLTCKAPAQAVVNGAVRRDAELHVGDTVQIGANTLRIIEPRQRSRSRVHVRARCHGRHARGCRRSATSFPQ